MVEVEHHPASCLFPLMPVDSPEFGELVADIRENGLLEAIVLCEGQIIDGRNRDRACRQAGVEPHFKEWRGDSPTAFVVSANLHRRHLTDDQRAAISAEALPLLEAEAKERQGTRTDLGKQLSGEFTGKSARQRESRTRAAQQFHVSPHKVRQAKKVREQAPQLHEQVKAGELDLGEAEKEVERRDLEKLERLGDPGALADLQASRYRKRYLDEMVHLHRLIAFDPDELVSVLEPHHKRALVDDINRARQWFDRIHHALNRSALEVVR